MSVGGPEKRRRQSEEGQSNAVRDGEWKAYLRPIEELVSLACFSEWPTQLIQTSSEYVDNMSSKDKNPWARGIMNIQSKGT